MALIKPIGIIDHGLLLGRDDDDHTIYFLADGSRVLSGNLVTSNGSILANNDASGILTLGGTGGSNNENIIFNFESVADEIGISSSTGATLVKLSSLNQELYGATPEFKITNSGDSNYVKLGRTDVNAEAYLKAVVLNQPSAVGSAVGFTAASSHHITINDSDAFTFGTGDFTILCWAKRTGSITNAGIFSLNGINAASGAILFGYDSADANSDYEYYISSNGSSFDIASNKSGGLAPLNEWRLIVLRRSGNTFTAYNNNVQVDTWTNSSAIHDPSSAAYIGKVGGYFNGVVDEFAIWHRALSVNDLNDLWNAGASRYINPASTFPTDGGSMGTNLKLLHHYEEGTGSSAADSSGNGNDGILVNTPSWVDGIVIPPTGAVDQEICAICIQDGTEPGEGGIITIGDSTYTPRVVLDGINIRFNTSGVERARFTASGTLSIDNNTDTVPAIDVINSVSQSESIFRHLAYDGVTELTTLEADGELIFNQDSKGVWFGASQDSSILFNGSGLIIQSDNVTATDYLQLRGGTNGIDFNIGATEQISLVDGILKPTTTNDIDLGTSDLLYKDFWQAGKHYLRDSAIGIYSQDDTFGDMFSDGGWRIGNSAAGAPTNYSMFSPDGLLTMVGTARVRREVQLRSKNFAPGVSGATEVNVGNYHGWAFTIGDDVVTVVEIPHDWDSSTDLEIIIYWFVNEAYSTGNGEVQWQINWSATPVDGTEAIDSPAHTGTIDFGDQNIPATAQFLTMSSSGTIAAASLSNGDLLGMTISRVALDGGSNPVAEPIMPYIEIHYLSNKLGEVL